MSYIRFLFLCTITLFFRFTAGMESAELLPSELKFKVATYLTYRSSMLEACNNLKKYGLICKEFFTFLRNNDALAKDLLDHLLRYTKDFDPSYLVPLDHLIHEETLTLYKESVLRGKELFKDHCTPSTLPSMLKLVQELKDSPAHYPCINSRWIKEVDKENNRTVHSNVLVEALYQGGSYDLISVLVEQLKANVNSIYSGPSALTIALYNFIRAEDPLVKEDLKKTISLLVKSGEYVDHLFHMQIELENGSLGRKQLFNPLRLAIHNGDLEVIQSLLTQEIAEEVVAEAALQGSIIALSGPAGRLEGVKEILKALKNSNTPNISFKLPLLHSLILFLKDKSARPQIKELLNLLPDSTDFNLRCSMDPKLGDFFPFTPLERAMLYDADEIVSLLSSKGAVIDDTFMQKPLSRTSRILLKRQDSQLAEQEKDQLLREYKELVCSMLDVLKSDYRILLQAILHLDKEAVAFLLEAGAPVNAPLNVEVREYGIVPSFLHFLVTLYHKGEEHKELIGIKPLILLFLNKGALTELIDNEGKTAAQKALQLGMDDLASYIDLISAIRALTKNDNDSLHLQIAQSLMELLSKGAHIKTDHRALVMACTYMWKELLEVLLNHGAQVNAITSEDEFQSASMLHVVVHALHGMLLEASNALDEETKDATFSLAFTNMVQPVISLLIDKGALRNKTDGEGKTAAQRALELGMPQVAEYISLYKTDLDLALAELLSESSSTDDTPTKKGILKEIEKLLGYGIDLRTKPKALIDAIASCDKKLVKFLLAHGIHADLLFSWPDASVEYHGEVNSFLHVLVHVINRLNNQLQAKVDTNELSVEEKDATFSSVCTRAQPIISLLIDNGTPKDRVNREGKTAAQKARELGMPGLADLIDLYTVDTRNNLIKAVRAAGMAKNDLKKNLAFKKVERLLSEGPLKLDEKACYVMLYSATNCLDSKLLTLLLSNGFAADIVFSREIEGCYPGDMNSLLHLAIFSAATSTRTAKEKLANSPASKELEATLFCDVYVPTQSVISALITHGTPKDRLNNRGKTAAQAARELGMVGLAEYIDSHPECEASQRSKETL